jgi:sialate O-acetylesterase
MLVKLFKKDKAMKDCKFMMVAVLCLMFLQEAVHAAVALPRVLSSHMVLQRDVNVPIWGTAAPGENVTVRFRDQVKSTTADAQGKWKVSLDPLQASELGADLTVTGSNILTLANVLVGEVWLGSGQSNMVGSASEYVINDTVLRDRVATSYPKIRLIRLESGTAVWKEATPANLREFSALLLSFGIPLQTDLNVPVGLLVGAVAGKPSGFFLSQEAFNSDPACQVLVNSDKTGVTGTTFYGVIGQYYETIIRPCIPYAIRGVLWDQGESGTGIKSIDQYTVMGALIKGWRKDWGQDFPFIYVQKWSGGGCAWDNTDPVTSEGEPLVPLPTVYPDYPKLEFEVFLRLRNYPNTFMSTSSDLGSGVHPVNKSGYGARAARVALGGVYGKNVEIYGPVYKSHRIVGNKVIISFDHVGKGLAFKTGELVDKLQGFRISGDVETYNYNRPRFFWADAVIEGDTVVVSSASVPNPVAVRWAWLDDRRWANLFNLDGLPALPFSTYRIPVPSTDASLSSLVPSNGMLAEVFTSAKTSYTSSVSSASAGMTITPVSANASATIQVRVNGGTYSNVASASPSASLTLAGGTNTIDVRVTAQNQVTTRTYSIAITRRTPYQDWTFGLGLSGAGAGQEGDLDADGLKNILEWAFGTNPTAGPGSTIQMRAGELIARGAPTTFTMPDGQGGVNYYALFGRRKDAASVGLIYAVEFSDTATAWTVRDAIPEVIAQDSEIETVVVPFPQTESYPPKTFFRVRVTGQ